MRMKLKLIIILLFATHLVVGQDAWVNFTNNYTVTDVVETPEGFWLASSGGLCFVDSVSNEQTYFNRGNSNIPSNTINDLLMHPNGDLWMSTSYGLSKYSNDDFILGPESVYGMLRITPDEKIVVAGYDSLYIQQADMNFEALAYPYYVAEIGGLEIDSSGIIFVNAINWFAETYVAKFENNEWEIIFSEFIYDTSIAIDKKNRLWFARDSGLEYYKNGDWIDIVEVDSFDAFRIGKMHVDIDDNVFLELDQDCPQLFKWDGIGLSEIDFVKDECIDCDIIGTSTSQSNLLFASNRKNGFYTFDSNGPKDYQPYSQSPLKSNFVRATLHPSDGSHIVVYVDNIQKIINGTWSDHTLPINFSGQIKYAHLDHNDKIWIGNAQKIWVFENDTWTELAIPGEITADINQMTIGANGDIWIQSGLNIARYRNGEWQNYKTAQHGLSSSIIKDLDVDDTNGDLWVSSFQGVRHFDGQTWITYDIPNGVNHAFSLAISNDGVYVHTGGLYKISEENVDLASYPSEGYYGPFESKMYFDRASDKLYLGGTGNLAVLENDEWEVITPRNSGIFNGRAQDFKIDTRNNLWLSGGSGISIYNEEGVQLTKVNEPVKIEALEIDVFPSLLQTNQVFIHSEVSGYFKIFITDMMGSVLQSDQLFLPSNQAINYALPHSLPAVSFISLQQGSSVTTKKLISIR